MQRLEDIVLEGITYQDIQKALERTVAESYPKRSNLIFLDVAYLYTFDKSDYPLIQRFNYEMRFSQKPNRNPMSVEWHRFLELWHSGEYVTLCGKRIKPLQIERTFDRVVNEFMERIAGAMAGLGDFAPMKFHAIGDGAEAGTSPSPSDTALVNELDRIDVTAQVGGGGMTVDGSTFMVIGNHDRFTTSGDLTESGIFDAEKPSTGEEEELIIDDRMGDHSIFPDSVEHISGQDGPGSTTVVYMCSS